MTKQICEYCGEPGMPKNPVRRTAVNPPCDGYEMQLVLVHKNCGAEMAREMVR